MAAAGDQISAEVAQAAADAGALARIRNKFFIFFRVGTVRGNQIVAPVGSAMRIVVDLIRI